MNQDGSLRTRDLRHLSERERVARTGRVDEIRCRGIVRVRFGGGENGGGRGGLDASSEGEASRRDAAKGGGERPAGATGMASAAFPHAKDWCAYNFWSRQCQRVNDSAILAGQIRAQPRHVPLTRLVVEPHRRMSEREPPSC